MRRDRVATILELGAEELGQLVVGELRLLQADDVRLPLIQPRQQPRQPLLDRVDVPRRDAHSGTLATNCCEHCSAYSRAAGGVNVAERMIEANGVELCTESFGRRADPPVLLIMGIGASMLWWEEGFCRLVAGGGRFVIRYDHRDTGRSVTSSRGARTTRAPT